MNGAPIHVTRHAIERYRERIGAPSEDAAIVALSGEAVRVAVDFGARIVRLQRGRIVIEIGHDEASVITVLPLDRLPGQLLPVSWGGPAYLPSKEMH